MSTTAMTDQPYSSVDSDVPSLGSFLSPGLSDRVQSLHQSSFIDVDATTIAPGPDLAGHTAKKRWYDRIQSANGAGRSFSIAVIDIHEAREALATVSNAGNDASVAYRTLHEEVERSLFDAYCAKTARHPIGTGSGSSWVQSWISGRGKMHRAQRAANQAIQHDRDFWFARWSQAHSFPDGPRGRSQDYRPSAKARRDLAKSLISTGESEWNDSEESLFGPSKTSAPDLKRLLNQQVDCPPFFALKDPVGDKTKGRPIQ